MLLLKDIIKNKEKIKNFDQLKNCLFKYDEIVTNIENQSCLHSSNFKNCCGVSYEYFNDIFCRTIIKDILNKNSRDIQEIILEELDSMDIRLKKLCKEGFVWDPDKSEKELLEANENWEERDWWNKYLPKGVNF